MNFINNLVNSSPPPASDDEAAALKETRDATKATT